MADQGAAQRAQQVGEQAEAQLNRMADAGAAQADALAGQAEQRLDAAHERAQGKAQDGSDALGDAGQDAGAQVQERLGQAPNRLDQFIQKASDGVNQTGRVTGDTLRGAASGVRSYAPQSGSGAEIAERLASGLERSGAYLERQTDSAIARLTDFVQRHPVATMLAGGGILLLLLRDRRRD